MNHGYWQCNMNSFIFNGLYKEGRREGLGYWEQNEFRYYGMFSDDLFNGYGIKSLQDDIFWMGYFQDDVPQYEGLASYGGQGSLCEYETFEVYLNNPEYYEEDSENEKSTQLNSSSTNLDESVQDFDEINQF